MEVRVKKSKKSIKSTTRFSIGKEETFFDTDQNRNKFKYNTYPEEPIQHFYLDCLKYKRTHHYSL